MTLFCRLAQESEDRGSCFFFLLLASGHLARIATLLCLFLLSHAKIQMFDFICLHTHDNI